MSQPNDAAFPVPGFRTDEGRIWQEPERGMELRDYFAAAALPWALAFAADNGGDVVSAARDAYAVADALLAARRSA
jgi:hypothetical protein